MGRLFWKFFFVFFLAQLTAVVGVGLTIWVDTRNHEATGIQATPPARAAVEAAAATLHYGGLAGMKSLLEGWQQRRMPQVYAVDEKGKELLQRPLTEGTLHAAIEIADSLSHERYVKRISAADGHTYLLFVPRFSRIPERDMRPVLESDDKPGYGIAYGLAPEAGYGPPPGGGYGSPPPGGGYGPPPGASGQQFGGPPPGAGYGPPPGSGYGPPPGRPYGGGFGNDRPREDEGPPHPLHLFPFKPLIAGAFVSLLFAALLAWYFSKPIRHLRNAFEEAANGRLDTRIGNAMGSRRDELADLGRDFDSMASRLGHLMQGQTRLLHHVSHELRSPLARMQMAIGLARQRPEKIPASLERIELESMRMDNLVGELLELSRLESGVTNLALERIDINELVNTVVDDAKFEAAGMAEEDHGCAEIVFAPTLQFVVMGQPDLLHRAIENIVRNALKYSPPHSTIQLQISQLQNSHDANAKTMQLSIIDQGLGVPPGELESIFQPFVRGSTASSSEGHGVGLAIAKQLIEAHGGTISARNLPKRGFAVDIVLPYLLQVTA